MFKAIMQEDEIKKADTKTLISEYTRVHEQNINASYAIEDLMYELAHDKDELSRSVCTGEGLPNYYNHLLELDKRIGEIPIELDALNNEGNAYSAYDRLISKELESSGYRYVYKSYSDYGKWTNALIENVPEEQTDKTIIQRIKTWMCEHGRI